MTVETLELGAFQARCYIVRDSGEALVIDPGWEHEEIARHLEKLAAQPLYILCTHGHIDHLSAAAPLKALFPTARIALHPADLPLYEMVIPEIDAYYPGRARKLPVDIRLDETRELPFGSQTIQVLPTPGHSPGGVCFYFEEAGAVFTGDTLFAGSVGRTDFPGGNMVQLLASIKTQLLSLPDETLVHPGHGPTTTIGDERRNNPFLE